MIIKINPGLTPSVGKGLWMAGLATGFELMGFMFERNGLCALSVLYRFRWRRR